MPWPGTVVAMQVMLMNSLNAFVVKDTFLILRNRMKNENQVGALDGSACKNRTCARKNFQGL